MLADILEEEAFAFTEIETDENETVSEADVLARYPTRYLLKTMLGKQAAKLASDDDLVKTFVILANYSLRVTPAIVRKWNDVNTSRPATEVRRVESSENAAATATGSDSRDGRAPAGAGLRWTPAAGIPGSARPPAFGPSANGASGPVPPLHIVGN